MASNIKTLRGRVGCG